MLRQPGHQPNGIGLPDNEVGDGLGKAYQESWTGYKLHIDTADGEIPISCALTAASVHDSQVAIPLAIMTAARVTNIYDLMDTAYDVTEIKQHG